ncbi:hypothetical protein CROQUDRAFT_44422, partial [Cronartium quercuum f. sp. fusiforme G11]
GCFTYFQPLYYSHNGFRYFYTPKEGRDPLPRYFDLEVFQVHTHYFMERNLVDYFWFDQMLAHVSTFNLVNKYNHAHVEETSIPTFQESQNFSPSLSASVCQDGMEISSLLFHYDAFQERLKVPNSGWDVLWYLDAITANIFSSHGSLLCNIACLHVILWIIFQGPYLGK